MTRAVWILTVTLAAARVLDPSPSAASEPPRSRAEERIAPIDPRRAAPLRLRVAGRPGVTEVALFDEAGRLRRSALGELRDLLADRRSDAEHPVHFRLATLLVAVSAHFGGRPLEVVSGYRHPSRSRYTQRSNHTRGRALDFRIPGVDNRRLFEVLRSSFEAVGVGYYPNSSFVHLDVRDAAALWVDYAGPGQAPCYSATPTADLRDGVVERLAPDAARARGCRG